MATHFIMEKPDHRVQLLNAQPFPASAKDVLYWAQANRRVGPIHALAYAVELANRVRLRSCST